MIDVSKLNLSDTDIAIVGMAGRFPDAKNVNEFWQNLKNGIESVRFFSDRELKKAGVDAELIKDPDYIKAGVVFDDLKMFDADFFGFSPREAQIMDPQHRHFLECSWEVLESAGCMPEDFKGSIGVFAGCGMNAYMIFNLLTNPDLLKNTGLFLLRHTGNDKDFLTTRVSYDLNLKGPSINIQTACSTSLVAAHIACQSLLNGECDLALAGGVTLELPHGEGYLFKEGEILSPDGHCRAFDEKAEGTIVGSGVGIVALRRAADAIRDGDHIHAIIKGSAINNDGSAKVGYLAPSVDGQAEAISIALAISNIDPETISYIETHGTGTAIGDPIEVAALTQAFKNYTDKKGFCRIGSLKTNIGHLDTAAGVAGLIKTVLSMENKQIPPSLNFEKPSPQIDFENSPFEVNNRLTEWESNGKPRRAGISSLGVGGTNAHIILQEAPQLPETDQANNWQLFNWSAKIIKSAEKWKEKFYTFLIDNPSLNLADVSYTLQIGRKSFANRYFTVGQDYNDTLTALKDGKRIFSKKNDDKNSSVVFMFPGGGAQYPNMGLELYAHEKIYRECVDECLEILDKKYDIKLWELMFPEEKNISHAAEQLQDPLNSILSIFIVEYSLAKLWLNWGIIPSAMTGHSLGEYAAACIADVMTLEEALFMVVLRGEIFHKMPVGGMIGLQLSESEIQPLLTNDVSIAAVNAPTLLVVSGTVDELAKFEQVLQSKEIEYNRLKISVAAHSAMLEPFLEEFRNGLLTLKLQKPSIPFISNLSGTFITDDEATSPDYWVKQLRSTVRFSDGMVELFKEEDRVFLEVGPGVTLSSLAKVHDKKKNSHEVIASIRHPKENISDVRFILEAVGKLWQNGAAIDWARFRGNEVRRKLPLPTYAFDHKPYWIEPGTTSYSNQKKDIKEALSKTENIDDWFYIPVWKQEKDLTNMLSNLKQKKLKWLIFSGEKEIDNILDNKLIEYGQEIITIKISENYKEINENNFLINLYDYDDYQQLVSRLVELGKIPDKIIHTWNYEKKYDKKNDNLDEINNAGFYCLLRLAKAFGEEGIDNPVSLASVTKGLQKLNKDEISHPENAALLGPIKVIPKEYLNLNCRLLDFGNSDDDNNNAEIIISEILKNDDRNVIAYRNSKRFVQEFESVNIEPNNSSFLNIKEKGIYLLTGGFGGIGFTLAAYLAKQYHAKLILLGRQSLPPRSSWDNLSSITNGNEKTHKVIQKVKELESYGAEVTAYSADVTDKVRMTEVVSDIKRKFGKINGVIHSAGVINDGIIQTKSEDSAQKVLNPKMKGTLILDELMKEFKPDFFLLFSSTSSIFGPAGQIDYTAANAFLDLYASSKPSGNGKTNYTTINWGQWRDVGMAARLASQLGLGPIKIDEIGGETLNNPILHKRIVNTPNEVEYLTELNPKKLWLLYEHRLKKGKTLIPGTAFLEFARTAMSYYTKSKEMVIKDVTFISPVMIDDDKKKLLSIKLQKNSDEYEFIISSMEENGTHEDWEENVRGIISLINISAKKIFDIHEILSNCELKKEEFSGIASHDHMIFGPRWSSLKEIHYGKTEAAAFIELPKEFQYDMEYYKIHPSLLDIATGSAQSLAGYDVHNEFFVPMTYSSIEIKDYLPSKIISHIRYKGGHDNLKDIAVFDINIMDENGVEVIAISDFMMKKVSDSSNDSDSKFESRKGTKRKNASELLEIGQHAAILPSEGIKVFEKILSANSYSQIAAVSQDLHALEESLSFDHAKKIKHTAEGSDEVKDNYAAPTNDIEKEIAEIWQEAMGIDKIGINDDFLELGGHSLLLTRIILRVRKKYSVDLSLSSLHEKPTIAQFASEVMKSRNNKEESSGITPVSREKYRVKEIN